MEILSLRVNPFLKKRANRDGALKLPAKNKDLNNIKYFKSYIIHERLFEFFFSVPPCKLKHTPQICNC